MIMYKRSRGEVTFDFVNVLLITLLCITIIYPFWDIIRLSLEDNTEMSTIGFKFFNKKNSLSSYYYLIFKDKLIIRAYANTILRTVVGTFVSVIFTFAGAYTLSKKRLPGRNLMTLFYVFTMFFSGGIIPTYFLIKGIKLYDHFLVYIIPGMVSIYNMIIMRNFIMAMDTALEESALIDGAGYLRILVSIVIPLSMPVIATVGLWNAVGHWNAWFDCLLYTRGTNLIVLQMMVRRMMEMLDAVRSGLSDFNTEEVVKLTSENVQAATIILTIGPIIIVYPFLQKYFVKGIMMGSLKG